MTADVDLRAVYVPSEEIVAREIEGELIIIPLVAGIGDAEDELFSLNQTGRAIWKLLDGTRTLSQIVSLLGTEYGAQGDTIEKDVMGLMLELLKRRIVIEKKDD
jgi:hypothetical protein